VDFEPTTLLFETINFIVLMLVLWRLVYRPLRRSIETRRGAVREGLDRAQRAREEAETLEATWRERQSTLEALRAEVRREALDEAERERAQILGRAREDADAERARVTRLLETERESAARWVRSTVWSRGTELAGRLLRELAPNAVDDALWTRLLEVVEARAEELGPVDDDGDGSDDEPEVELTGARMPSRAQSAALKEVILRRFGVPPRLTVREDDELVAGYTVRIGDRLFDGSIAGELDAFRELARDLSDEAA